MSPHQMLQFSVRLFNHWNVPIPVSALDKWNIRNGRLYMVLTWCIITDISQKWYQVMHEVCCHAMQLPITAWLNWGLGFSKVRLHLKSLLPADSWDTIRNIDAFSRIHRRPLRLSVDPSAAAAALNF